MTTPAVIMMVIAMVLIWGGLIAAIISLLKHDRRPEQLPSAEFAESHRDL